MLILKRCTMFLSRPASLLEFVSVKLNRVRIPIYLNL
jgi:hypothetical protein